MMGGGMITGWSRVAFYRGGTESHFTGVAQSLILPKWHRVEVARSRILQGWHRVGVAHSRI